MVRIGARAHRGLGLLTSLKSQVRATLFGSYIPTEARLIAVAKKCGRCGVRRVSGPKGCARPVGDGEIVGPSIPFVVRVIDVRRPVLIPKVLSLAALLGMGSSFS